MDGRLSRPALCGRSHVGAALPRNGSRPPSGKRGKSEAERSTRVRKQDLIREVANAANLSEAQATKAVNAMFDAIQESLARNDEVQLSGFGSFRVVERAA